jgi:protease II
VLAVAHVRGGGELGSAWHVHGKKLKKVGVEMSLKFEGKWLAVVHVKGGAGLGSAWHVHG